MLNEEVIWQASDSPLSKVLHGLVDQARQTHTRQALRFDNSFLVLQCKWFEWVEKKSFCSSCMRRSVVLLMTSRQCSREWVICDQFIFWGRGQKRFRRRPMRRPCRHGCSSRPRKCRQCPCRSEPAKNGDRWNYLGIICAFVALEAISKFDIF